MTYSEKLLDPRWIKRRDEIKRRDDWTCRRCGIRQGPLYVHHKRYFSNREPWNYSDAHLITLCADCHKDAHCADPILLHPTFASHRRKFSVAAFSKEQRRRLVAGMIWINRNMLGQANKLRAWVLKHGQQYPETACAMVEEFVEANRG